MFAELENVLYPYVVKITSWNLFGKINTVYLFGKYKPKSAILIYTLISLFFIMLGTIVSSDFVWELTDMFNNLMGIPNVIALFALTGLVINTMKTAKDE